MSDNKILCAHKGCNELAIHYLKNSKNAYCATHYDQRNELRKKRDLIRAYRLVGKDLAKTQVHGSSRNISGDLFKVAEYLERELEAGHGE